MTVTREMVLAVADWLEKLDGGTLTAQAERMRAEARMAFGQDPETTAKVIERLAAIGDTCKRHGEWTCAECSMKEGFPIAYTADAFRDVP